MKKVIKASLNYFFLLKASSKNGTLTMATYCSDLFEGEINPGTTTDQKLYTLTISNRNKDDLLTIDQENVADILSVFRHDSNSFRWDKLINNVQDAVGKTLRILEDFSAGNITLGQTTSSHHLEQ